MDALLTTFIAAALAEFGDKTQLLVIALAARYGKPRQIIAGVVVAGVISSLLAAAGGVLIHSMIAPQAALLLIAVVLLFAGLTGFMRDKAPEMGMNWKTGAFITTAICYFLLEFADKTQFLTASLAAHYNSFALAGAGAAAGVVAINVPAAILAERMKAILPMRAIRIGIGIIFLLAGFIVGVNALRLV